MKLPTLYGKDSKGALKLWEVFTEGNSISVRHGKLGGKIQTKVTYAEPKNIGKVNETSAEQQAMLEAEAKWIKQKKKGYFETKEEALDYVDKMPMKAQNYNDYSHKVRYPCYIQPKLNGLRLLLDSEGNAQSKQGEDYVLPEHWQNDIAYLYSNGFLEGGFDGEVFAGYQKQGGLSLQQIVSAFRKPNEDTHKLKFYVYDTTHDADQRSRITAVKGLNLSYLDNIIPVESVLVYNEEEADKYYHKWLKEGAEGMVYRNLDAKYEFGKRSYNLIKRKPRQTTEAKVLSARKDKNSDGVLNCMLENGVEFECLMRKDSHETINFRKYENALTLVDGFIEFEYEEESDSGVPTKPVGVRIRTVNATTFEPME